MTIEVCERTMDHGHRHDEKGQWVPTPKFHAQIKDKPGIWGCGLSRAEAIGDLIRSHAELFNIEITDLGKLPR